jgi:uncharacterized protein (TIGR02246 family)
MRRATAAHTEDPAILEKVKQWQDGWKARDAELFAKPFATDADYVIVNGRHLKGRKAIEEGHRGLFGRIPKEDPKESESVRDEVTIRYLRPDVALVHTVGFGTVHNIATLVLIKGAQGWRSQHFNGLQLKRNPQGDQIGNQVPLVAKYSPAA